MNKEQILQKLKYLKPFYQKEGLEILGLFGSYAKDTDTQFSDIDIVYTIHYDEFSKYYIDGFSKILRINEIKKELENELKKDVDFVSDKNSQILQGLIYV